MQPCLGGFCSLLLQKSHIHMFRPSREPFCHGPETVLHQAGIGFERRTTVTCRSVRRTPGRTSPDEGRGSQKETALQQGAQCQGKAQFRGAGVAINRTFEARMRQPPACKLGPKSEFMSV